MLQRPESSSTAEPSTSRSITSRGRGRAKFTSSPEYAQAQATEGDGPSSETVASNFNSKSRPPSRRRLDYERQFEPRQRPQDSSNRHPTRKDGSYEVQEVVDDIPRDNAKRPLLRPRVVEQQIPTSQRTPSKPETPAVPTVLSSLDEGITTEEEKIVATSPEIIASSTNENGNNEEESNIPPIHLFSPEPSERSTSTDLMRETAKTFKTVKPTKTAPQVNEEPRRFLTRSKPARLSASSVPAVEEPQRSLPRAHLKSRANTRVVEESTSSTPAPRTNNRLRPVVAAKKEYSTKAPPSTTTRTVTQRTRPTRPAEVPTTETPRQQQPQHQLYQHPPARRNEYISQIAANLENNFRTHETVIPESNFRTRNFRKRPLDTIQPDIIVSNINNNRRQAIQQEVSRLEEEFGNRGPTLVAENNFPTRIRTSRRSDHHISRRIDTSEEIEEIFDSKQFRPSSIETAQSRRKETIVAADNQGVLDSKEQSKLSSRRPNKSASHASTNNEQNGTTARQITRNFRQRTTPHFDETKLEVLPLFESDAKTEKSTAVDSVPEISKAVPPEATTPLTTSTRVTTETSKRTEGTTKPVVPSRRIPSRTTIREVKNNKLESEPRSSRTNRRHPASSTPATVSRAGTRENYRNSRNRDVKTTNETSTTASRELRGRGRHHSESTTEALSANRRKLEPRTRPKKLEPNVPETRLQNLSPRRSVRPSNNKATSTTTTSTVLKPKTTTASARAANRAVSRFNKMEDELSVEEFSESNVSKTVRKLEDATVNPKLTRYTKRGTSKDHSDLTSSEEQIDDSDNYPEQFKALIQAKKQKVLI